MKSGVGFFAVLLFAGSAFAGGLYDFKGEWFTETEQYAYGYIQGRGRPNNLSGTIEEILKKDEVLVHIWKNRSAKKLKNCSFEVTENENEVELKLTIKRSASEPAISKTFILPKIIFKQLVDYKENRLTKLTTSPLTEVLVTPYRTKIGSAVGVKTIYIETKMKNAQSADENEIVRIDMQLKEDGTAMNQHVSFGNSFTCAETVK